MVHQPADDTNQRGTRTVTDQPTDTGNVAALLELCDAQQGAIERLQRALEQHEEIERDRHLLKRMLAHELRTPLTAVVGTLHTLTIPSLSAEKQEELREKALRQAEQLDELIDDILLLSDPHQATVDRAPQEWIGLEELVAEVAEQVAHLLPRERLRVELPIGLSIRTVPNRVRQILVNLLVNAAKYAPPDTPVTLSATRLSEHLVLEVVDRGPGIDPASVETLFDAYRRGPSERGDGLGLGLYLTRNLVRSLAGSIELLPRAEGGTLARVSLPQKRVEDALAPGSRAHLRAVPDEPASP